MNTIYGKALVQPTVIGTLGARRLSVGALPVIDIGPLFTRHLADKRKVADAIGEAAREIGFFYIAGHRIPQPSIDAVYSEAERFFALPQEQKLAYAISRSANHRGYVSQNERGDYSDERKRLYEAFDLALDLPQDDPDYLGGNPLLGPNVWPELDGFRETVYGYYNEVAALAETLCRAFEIHLRLAPGYFRQFMRKPTSQLRLLHYLENDSPVDEKDMQMGAHTDYECFTLLNQSKPGLQVLTTENTWLEAPPLDGAYVVNIGDMMEAWTNGAFKATPHRVVNTGRERYSLPYFAAADYHAVIKPVPSISIRNNPPRYPRIVAGQHLLGQMLRDFAYLKRRYQDGKLKLPFPAPNGNLFENRLKAA